MVKKMKLTWQMPANLIDLNMYEQQIFVGNLNFVYVFTHKNYGAVRLVIMTDIMIINWNFIEEEVS